jgi:hypothetical protein
MEAIGEDHRYATACAGLSERRSRIAVSCKFLSAEDLEESCANGPRTCEPVSYTIMVWEHQ